MVSWSAILGGDTAPPVSLSRRCCDNVQRLINTLRLNIPTSCCSVVSQEISKIRFKATNNAKLKASPTNAFQTLHPVTQERWLLFRSFNESRFRVALLAPSVTALNDKIGFAMRETQIHFKDKNTWKRGKNDVAWNYGSTSGKVSLLYGFAMWTLLVARTYANNG